MPGFILSIHNGPSFKLNEEKRGHLLVERKEGPDFTLERRTLPRFLGDKVFDETPELLILTEGVILNKSELTARYAPSGDFAACIREMYRQEGETFFNAFRGSFSGVLYDKKADKWLVYTDHIGDKQVFWAQTRDGWLLGSEIGFLAGTLQANGLPLTLDETGAYQVLTHGFTFESRTLLREIHKLIPGRYWKLEKGQWEHLRYHRFHNTPKEDMTVEEAVEGIDRLFRQAIRREFDKDREYGYRHLCCLSGGLDSRMTCWVAHEMGYTEQLNITFGQSNCPDFSIAQSIATDLEHDFLFKPLDHGHCVDLLDEVTDITWGSANFFSLCHGKSMEDLINYAPFGLIHTGQIGDSVIGTFFRQNGVRKDYHVGMAAYSQELIERLAAYRFEEDYDNEEIFCLYTRAFTGANQGLLTFQENSESYSPFTDVDVLEFCYTIPVHLRYGHKVYFDWILRKYPGAARYKWEKTHDYIRAFENKTPRSMQIGAYRLPAVTEKQFWIWLNGAILRRLGLRKKGEKTRTVTIATADNMNPVDYWYAEDGYMARFITGYWQQYKSLLPQGQLGKDMQHLFEDCVVYDKFHALTVLATLRKIEKP
ncbi:MAG: hypothetical protein J5871_05285 [Bacteroidales bacterium]|nr:hypothetical protein [Bacteroidales bacterium]